MLEHFDFESMARSFLRAQAPLYKQIQLVEHLDTPNRYRYYVIGIEKPEDLKVDMVTKPTTITEDDDEEEYIF